MLDRKALTEMLLWRGRDQEALFARARDSRADVWRDQVIVRGVIEVTSACVRSCDYCPMRNENSMSRYIYSTEDIINLASQIAKEKLNVVFLQGGEVPGTTQLIADVIPDIKALFQGAVEILLCLGNKPYEDYKLLKDRGADSYILKHETSDAILHHQLRHAPIGERINCLNDLIDLGYKVGIGTIVGLPGQSIDSLVNDLLMPSYFKVTMTSASPFIPAQLTPLANSPHGDVDTTLNAIALMRIMYPHLLIPTVSALEKLSPGSQVRGLEAGANVVTINFTPPSEVKRYAIYGSDRFVVRRDHALQVIEMAGLQPAISL